MNMLDKQQKQPTTCTQASPLTDSAVDLMSMAEPIGTFAGSTDFVLRFRNGELVAENTGDQGGGQN
jgi:hypothetical protein